jgi:hypothetical protein
MRPGGTVFINYSMLFIFYDILLSLFLFDLLFLCVCFFSLLSFNFWDIFQGAGVLQYHPGALVEAGFQWILIGSNDLHRFWDHCYVGHAVNIKNDRGSS